MDLLKEKIKNDGIVINEKKKLKMMVLLSMKMF